MYRRILMNGAAGATLLALMFVCAAVAEVTPVTSVEGVSEYQLDNGARVLLLPDPSSTKFTVNMTVLVGSRHEGYGEAGMAHLLEHMLFKGTPKNSNIPKALQDRGASFNGTTWLDRTNYYETLSADEENENLEFAIQLEADRLVNSYIKGEDLAKEFTVVRNEFERTENDPQRVLLQRMQGAAYEWHNYGQTTIGNRSDIERVPITNLREFYRKHYRVDNIVVIVTGKFEPKTALALIEKHFGGLAKPKTSRDKTYTIEPAQDGERTVVVRRVGEVQTVAACYHICSASHEDFAAVDVLANILGTEPSGRMYKRLVETKLASSVYSYLFDTHDPGLIWAITESPQTSDLEEVRRTLIGLLEEIGEKGVTKEEVSRAQQEFAQGFEKESSSSSAMASALSEWSARGDWRLRYLHRDRVEKVTPEDVQRVAAKYLTRNNRTIGLFIPTEEAQRVSVPDSPDLAGLLEGYEGREQVAQGEAFDSSLDNIAKRTSKANFSPGIKVALLPKKSRGERVRLSLSLRYGNADSLKGKVNASDVLPTLMTRGTKELTFEEFQDALTKYGATISGSGQPGLATFSVETKREHLVPVLDLFQQMLREPRLPEQEFDVIQRQQLTSLESALTDPGALASNRLRRAFNKYPKDHVLYEPTIEEKIERWQDTKLADVKELHQEFLSANRGELAIVGDFDPVEINKILEETFADWKSPNEYARIPNPAAEGVEGSISTINTPDKANAFYLAATRFRMTDSHKDYPGLVIGNFILGGGSLASRLGDRVRQQEGLSYGVGSIFRAHPIDANAMFAVQAITNPQYKDKLTAVIREELEKLLKDGITEEELARAKQGYLKSQQLRRSQDSGMLSMLSSNLFLERSPEFQKQHEADIEALTVEAVNTAMRNHVDPKKFVIVLSGDFEKAEE